MSELAPLAADLGGLGTIGFWSGVGVLAGVYLIFALGLQINVGFTGIVNFGQAGFAAIGAYGMAVLSLDLGLPLLLAIAGAIGIAVLVALLIGLTSLRLRADYFAIATLAMAETIRMFAQNASSITGGNQGLLGFDLAWADASATISDWLASAGIDDAGGLLPLLLVVWAVGAVAILALRYVQSSPWGRVLRAIREDEDAARSLSKNVLRYRLQSLTIGAGLGALAGVFLALNLSFVNPQAFEPQVTFIGYAVLLLGGLASYAGVAVGALIMWTLLEATRFVDLPLTDTQVASLRFVIIGLTLILLMAFRPQGLAGKRQEMVLGD